MSEKRVTAQQKRFVISRAQGCCEYCRSQQQWAEHFVWNENCTLIIGLTPTGRATVETLHLNKLGLVNLRRILYAAGEHPPPNLTELDK